MTDPQLLSSARGDWETPMALFNALNAEFDFDLDFAASKKNAKCKRFITAEDDAFACEWKGKRPFGNPPYGKGNAVGKWVELVARKAMEAGRQHVVALLASRTDTAWFHDYVMPLADEVRFIRGRLIFELGGQPVINPKDGSKQGATFPSALFVFRRKPLYRVNDRPLFRSISTSGVFLLDEEPPL